MTTQRDINRRSAQFNQKGINEKATTIKNIQSFSPLYKQQPLIRRAITTEAAGSDNTITANLYDSAGVEQTTGDESGITVNCDIIGGTALNAAMPRLVNDTPMPVYKHNGAWYCYWPFMADIECGCS